MLMVMMIAATTAATPATEAPQRSSAACNVTVEKVELIPEADAPIPTVPSFGWSIEANQQALVVSKIVDGEEKTSPDAAGTLPEAAEADRAPAVNRPKCREEARPKRKRRPSDYPMA